MGRLVATILKVAFSIAIALLLTLAMILNYFFPPKPMPNLPPSPVGTVTGLIQRCEVGEKSLSGIHEMHSGLPSDWPTLYAGGVRCPDVLART